MSLSSPKLNYIWLLVVFLISQCQHSPANEPLDTINLKYNIYFVEAMLVDRIAECKRPIKMGDCSSLQQNGLYEAIKTEVVPNYLSLNMDIIPMTEEKSVSASKQHEAKILYSYNGKCTLFESYIVVHSNDSILALQGNHHKFNVTTYLQHISQYEDTLRKYKDVLNPWLRQEAQRRGIIK